MKSTKKISPRVGMLCTEHLSSDTHGAKILTVSIDGKIEVGYFHYPSRGEDRDFKETDELPKNCERKWWSLRKSGTWREVGCPDKSEESWLSLGRARNYYCLEE